MFCARCDEPIRPDEPSKTYDVPAPTGPGTTVTVHAQACKPSAPRQTYPARPRAW